MNSGAEKWLIVALVVIARTADVAAQEPAPPRWYELALGLGGAYVTVGGDTLLRGGWIGASAISVVANRGQWGLEITGRFTHAGGYGDCCVGVPYNSVGVSVGAVHALGAGSLHPRRPTAAAGIGAYYVFPDFPKYGKPVAHVTVPGLHASVEAPLIRGQHAAFAVGAAGVLIPRVHEQTTAQFMLIGAIRIW